MSHLVASSAPITSAHTVKQYAGFGILGSDIPSTGDNGGSPVLNDGVTSTSEYYWRLETAPSSGMVTLYPDLSFQHSGAADGTWTWVYRLYWANVDGSSGNGTATVTDVFGSLSQFVLTAQGGTYSLTGSDVTLTVGQNTTNYQFTAQGGNYTLTGQSVGLHRNRSLTSSGGSYALSGASVILKRSKLIVAAGGNYANSGASATILRSKYIVSSGGAYVYTGQNVNLYRNRNLVTLGGTYNYQGSSSSYTVLSIGGYPAPNQVLLGVVYGSSGQYTGTLDIGNKYRIDVATGNIVMIIDSDKVMTL